MMQHLICLRYLTGFQCLAADIVNKKQMIRE